MSEAVLTPLSTLWSALAPRSAATTPPPDVGAIAAAAEAQGHARGLAEAEAALAPRLQALDAALAALDAALVIDPAALQPVFAELATRIAEAVIGGELRQSPVLVERLAAEALAAVTVDGETMLYVAPDDPLPGGLGVRVAVDPELAPGSVRVETAGHVVAAGLADRLAAVVAGLA